MDPMAKSAIVWVIIIAFCTLICLFWKKLPFKLGKALKTSLVFVFTANLLTNLLRGTQINNNVGVLTGATEQIIFMLGIALGLTLISFLIIYFVKNEELQRKIFFGVALVVFASTFMFWTIEMIQIGKTLPAHLCRQIAYVFPLVYFSKKGRGYTLPFVTMAALLGGFVTVFFNFDLLNIPFWSYGMLDQVLVHSIMIILPFAIWKSGEVKHSVHHIWQFTVGILICTIFALGQNYLEFLKSGNWGSGMYLKDALVEGIIPTWAFFIIIFAAAYAIILCSAYSGKIGSLFKKMFKKKLKSDKS